MLSTCFKGWHEDVHVRVHVIYVLHVHVAVIFRNLGDTMYCCLSTVSL